MSILAALAEDCGCYWFSGDQVQKVDIIKGDPITEDFELSRRKVLGKSWILCGAHPHVEMECEGGCGQLGLDRSVITSQLCYLCLEVFSLSLEEFLTGYSLYIKEFQPLSAMLSQNDRENLLHMHSPRK